MATETTLSNLGVIASVRGSVVDTHRAMEQRRKHALRSQRCLRQRLLRIKIFP
jgi:hypothetical protein